MSVRAKPESCLGCPCHPHGLDFSAIEGTGASGVMFVGEASGEHEQRDRLPFRPYAPAGAVLQRVLSRMGLDRAQFSITNVLRCRPKNNWLEGAPWEYGAVSQCRPNLNAAIVERRPRAIVALGTTALRELTGLVGEAQGVSHLHGYVLPLARPIKAPCTEPAEADGIHHPNCFICGGSGYLDRMGSSPDSVPVIPAFHPAYLRRGKASLQGVFSRAIFRALHVASGKDHDYLWGVVPTDRTTHGTLEYNTHPSLDDARSFALKVLAEGNAPVAYDIETSESASLDEDAREGFVDTTIQLVQFSMASGVGIAIPWADGYRDVVSTVLGSPNLKCGHNVWLFDNKVLRAAGEREGLDLRPRGVIHDTLQMFHHWQPDLPAHLQFAASFIRFPFPWKHLAGTDIEFYGCCDVDATLRLYTFLEATLKAEGLWDDSRVAA